MRFHFRQLWMSSSCTNQIKSLRTIATEYFHWRALWSVFFTLCFLTQQSMRTISGNHSGWRQVKMNRVESSLP